MNLSATFAWIIFRAGMVLSAVYLFHIQEGFGLDRLIPWVMGGFILHSFLPERYRAAVRVCLFAGAACSVLGTEPALVLLGLSAALIAICHIPGSLYLRAALLVVAACVLALCRVGQLDWIRDRQVIPILASIFMFRLGIYLFEQRSSEGPRACFWDRLGYFFMLPNLCFPIFPVVDYRAYLDSYDPAEFLKTCRRGLSWITLGLSHLLLYRLIYFFWTPVPSEVRDAGSFFLYVSTAYLVYLRISGQFHIIIGILALFGFDLPPTHRFYFFTTGFTDYWRRVNIYWKDLMMKSVYYPVLLRCSALKPAAAYASAIAAVFFVTWFLHGYQWFWIRGRFPTESVDMIFWAFLGAGMIGQVLWGLRAGRTVQTAAVEDLRNDLVKGARITGMFLLLSLMWSVWSAGSFAEWQGVWRRARVHPNDLLMLMAIMVVVSLFLGAWLTIIRNRPVWTHRIPRSAIETVFCAALLVAAFLPSSALRHPGASTILSALKDDRLNPADEALVLKGYYNELLQGGSPTARFWEGSMLKPADWTNAATPKYSTKDGGLLQYRLLPNIDTTFKGTAFRTNEWGMRDKSYPSLKPPGTYRIVFLGGSYVMGTGVEAEEDFESLIETRLNGDARFAGRKFEALNFGSEGYTILSQLIVLETRALAFGPNAVLFVIHDDEEERQMRRLARALAAGCVPEFGYIRRLLKLSGVEKRDGVKINTERLMRYRGTVMRWALHRAADIRAARKVPMAIVYLPAKKVSHSDRMRSGLVRTLERYREYARRARLPFWSLEGVYDGYQSSDVEVAPWDKHPNRLGHLLIARKLYGYLTVAIDRKAG